MTARSILHIAILAFSAAAAAIGTAQTATYDFAYEGRLTDATGKPLDGPIALRLSFYREESGGNPIMAIESGLEAVELQDGIFQVSAPLSAADYGTVFPSPETAVFVEVTDLTHAPTAPYPRRQVTTLPYAARVPVDGTTVKFNSQGRLTAIPPGAGKLPGNLVQLDGSSRLPALDGSQLTGVSATSVGGAAPASTNTASTLVKRDSSGNFSAGTITANVTGNVSGSAGSVQASGVKGFTAGSVPFANASGLTQNNAKFFWDNANSRLGIGTTSPASALDVNGAIGATALGVRKDQDARTQIAISNMNAGTFSGSRVLFTNSVGYSSLDFNSFDTLTLGNVVNGGPIAFSTTTAAGVSGERLRIDGAGNVGIGTTSPGSLLDLRQDQNAFTGITVTNGLDQPAARTGVKLQNTDSNAGLAFTQATGTDRSDLYLYNHSTDGSLLLSVDDNGAVTFSTNFAERMRVAHDGNVGIGTTAPNVQLQIATGTMAGLTSGWSDISSMNGNRVPQLQVTDNLTGASAIGVISSDGVLGIAAKLFATSSSAWGLDATGAAALPLVVTFNNAERLRIDGATGNVGIGTTSPGALLDVKGHVANSGASASVGTCGTAPAIVGNDTRGRVTTGGGAVTSCVITFAAAFVTAPYCVVTWSGAGASTTSFSVSATTTDVTVYLSAASPNADFNYLCMQ